MFQTKRQTEKTQKPLTDKELIDNLGQQLVATKLELMQKDQLISQLGSEVVNIKLQLLGV